MVYGHEHVPSSVWVDGTLYLNPGTATSPEEEDDDPTVAVVAAGSTGLSVRFIPLERKPVEESVARPARARGRLQERGSEET